MLGPYSHDLGPIFPSTALALFFSFIFFLFHWHSNSLRSNLDTAQLKTWSFKCIVSSCTDSNIEKWIFAPKMFGFCLFALLLASFPGKPCGIFCCSARGLQEDFRQIWKKVHKGHEVSYRHVSEVMLSEKSLRASKPKWRFVPP